MLPSPFNPLPAIHHAHHGCLAYADPAAKLAGPAILFGFVLLIIVAVKYFGYQREKLWHETARTALEKGQPLPGQPPKSRGQRWTAWKDLRFGLVILAIGLALFLHSHTGLAGFVLIGVGIALLLSALLQGVFSPRRDDVRDPPAGS